MSKMSYVSGQLHRISDQLAAAEKKEFQETPDNSGAERIIPEPEPHIRARFDEMMRLRRDMTARLTDHICRFTSEKQKLEQRGEIIGKAAEELEAMMKRIENTPVPAFDDPKFKSKLTDMNLMLENIRLDDIRITARNTASALPSSARESRESGSSFSELGGGELFKKGFFFFLPLMLLVLLSVLILSAAFVTAWLVAF